MKKPYLKPPDKKYTIPTIISLAKSQFKFYTVIRYSNQIIFSNHKFSNSHLEEYAIVVNSVIHKIPASKKEIRHLCEILELDLQRKSPNFKELKNYNFPSLC